MLEEALQAVRVVHFEGLVAGGVDDQFFQRVLLEEVEGLFRVEDAPVFKGDAPLRVVPACGVEVRKRRTDADFEVRRLEVVLDEPDEFPAVLRTVVHFVRADEDEDGALVRERDAPREHGLDLFADIGGRHLAEPFGGLQDDASPQFRQVHFLEPAAVFQVHRHVVHEALERFAQDAVAGTHELGVLFHGEHEVVRKEADEGFVAGTIRTVAVFDGQAPRILFCIEEVITQDGLVINLEVDRVRLVELHVHGAEELVERIHTELFAAVLVKGDVLEILCLIARRRHEPELGVQHHDGVAKEAGGDLGHLLQVCRRLDDLVELLVPGAVPVENGGHSVHDGQRVRLLAEPDEAASVEVGLGEGRVAAVEDDAALLQFQVTGELVSRENVEVVREHGLCRVQVELRSSEVQFTRMEPQQFGGQCLAQVFVQNVGIELHIPSLLPLPIVTKGSGSG